MIFVDTNVFMYAVGKPHSLQSAARAFFFECADEDRALVTSAEVLQELVHAYLPAQRIKTLDAALRLAYHATLAIFSVAKEDVIHARTLINRMPMTQGLGARDLLHIAVCDRHDVKTIKTYDQGLSAAFKKWTAR